MAKRRMFMENIIESDDFKKLPFGAQVLYFHLNMQADDDGLVGNAASTMRSVGIKQKSFDILAEKNYIITFKSGIVAITHWLSHNHIRKDRKTPTRFKEEFSSIQAVNDEYYSKLDNIQKNQGVSALFAADNAAQVSKDKDSEVKDSTVKYSTDESSEAKTSSDEYSSENTDISTNGSNTQTGVIDEEEEMDEFDKEIVSIVDKETRALEILNDPILLKDFKRKIAIYCKKYYGTNFYIDFINEYLNIDIHDVDYDLFDDYKYYVDAWMKKRNIKKMII